MAKKKEAIETVEAKAFTEPNVTSRININTNQDDLISLVVEERSEQLETLIRLQEKKIERAEEAINDVIHNYYENYRKNIRKSAEYKAVEDTITKLGLTTSENCCDEKPNYLRKICYDLSKNDVLYKCSSIDDAEETKNVLASFKRYTTSQCLRACIDKSANVNLEASNTCYKYNKGIYKIENPIGISIQYHKDVQINEKDQQKIKDTVNPMLVSLTKEKNLLYDLQLEYLGIKYGANKIKNQILKASLKKSEDGRAILDMLSKATNIKLLG